jgi:hypothetical protein
VLLKRNAGATLDELLGAADYVRGEGNEDIVLCERGVRGFEPTTRYTLDLAAVPGAARADRPADRRRSEPCDRPADARRSDGARRDRGRSRRAC